MENPVDRNSQKADAMGNPPRHLRDILRSHFIAIVKQLESHDQHWCRRYSCLGRFLPATDTSPEPRLFPGTLPDQPGEILSRLQQTHNDSERIALWQALTMRGAGSHEVDVLGYIESLTSDPWFMNRPEREWIARWQPTDEQVRSRLLAFWKKRLEQIHGDRESLFLDREENTVWRALTVLGDDEAALLELVKWRLEVAQSRLDAEVEGYIGRQYDHCRYSDEEREEMEPRLVIPAALAQWRPRSAGVRRQLCQWWEAFLGKPWGFGRQLHHASRIDLWEALFDLREHDGSFLETLSRILPSEQSTQTLYSLTEKLEKWWDERKGAGGGHELGESISRSCRKILEDIVRWQISRSRQLGLAGMAYVFSASGTEREEILDLVCQGISAGLSPDRLTDDGVVGMVYLGQLITRVQSRNGWREGPSEGYRRVWDVLIKETGKYPRRPCSGDLVLLENLADMSRQCSDPALTGRLLEKLLLLARETESTNAFLMPIILLAIRLTDEEMPEARTLVWKALCEAGKGAGKQDAVRRFQRVGQWEMVLRQADLSADSLEGIADNDGLLRRLRSVMHWLPDDSPDSVWNEIYDLCREALEMKAPAASISLSEATWNGKEPEWAPVCPRTDTRQTAVTASDWDRTVQTVILAASHPCGRRTGVG